MKNEMLHLLFFLPMFFDQVQFMVEHSHLSMDFDKVSIISLLLFLQSIDSGRHIKQMVALNVEI